MNWHAIHFFIHDLTYHNSFLVDYLKSVIEQLRRQGILIQWFYISYWQGGNHVRFRYKSPDAEKVKSRLAECFERFLEIYEPGTVMDEATYYQVYANNKEQVEDITWIPDKTMAAIDYEPEYDRYGGRMVMEASERVFQLSSQYALELRAQIGDSLTKRMIAALDMFQVALQQIEDQKSFLYSYKQFWSKFVISAGNSFPIDEFLLQYNRHAKRELQEGGYYQLWASELQKSLVEIGENQTAYPNGQIAQIMVLSSHVHMTNNRLGIAPYMESLLAEILLKRMEDLDGR